ncbi:sugar transferase [Pygmaiobacter massiliensis]|uniref:sugar transferase n=1 Tax=Pygmaiobacter massiliensis TaxID=1917873 RepID=UPI000C7B9A6C|nr:sugar transferase [Pygmaiobacter massiliensis]
MIWLILYIKFGQVYRAFKIASNAIGETAFSQFLSIGFADLILYVAGCLVARQYINVLPGAGIVILQSVIGFFWATRSKQYFLAHVEPRRCLLIYDADITRHEQIKGQEFAKKLEATYGHLFEIEERIPVSNDINETLVEIANYPVIFIYDMRLEKRSKIVNYCVNTGKRFYVTLTVEDIVARGYNVKHFIDTPLMEYNGSFKNAQTYFGKRALDIVISLLMLILTSPIMLIAALAIKLEDGGAGDIIGTTKKSSQLCVFSMA